MLATVVFSKHLADSPHQYCLVSDRTFRPDLSAEMLIFFGANRDLHSLSKSQVDMLPTGT